MNAVDFVLDTLAPRAPSKDEAGAINGAITAQIGAALVH